MSCCIPGQPESPPHKASLLFHIFSISLAGILSHIPPSFYTHCNKVVGNLLIAQVALHEVIWQIACLMPLGLGDQNV